MHVERTSAVLAVATALLLCACRERSEDAQPVPATATAQPALGAPSLADLQSATYSGFEKVDAPITLTNGVWEGAPYAPGAAARPTVTLARGFRLTGDLDGDGTEEAVVVLAQNSGGSGTFDYVAVVKRQGAGIENVATAALGDRVQIRTARIEGARLLVSTVQAGKGDAACCPGDLVDRTWTLAGRTLTESPATSTGRLSAEALAGSEWVLRAWDVREPAPAEVEVTLTYAEGRFAGKSGCNRYTGAAKPGTAPGELAVGPMTGTRMACAEPQSSLETRFLKQLGTAKRFGFFLGQLAISYDTNAGTPGTMLFSARAPQ